MQVFDHAPMAPLTTLRLGGPARRLVTAERESELLDIVREVDLRKDALLVIGGGSNLVVADAGFDGTVVRVGTRGRNVSEDEITVQAGEPWDDLVRSLVDDGFAGVECLAGIPGLTGATPLQNVGAYGQDVSETIVRLRALDRERGEIVTFEREACEFAYRDSVFRGRDRHVILDVTFRLERSRTSKPIRYAELARALEVPPEGTAPLAEVRDTILELRKKKGMVLDPSDPDTTSAGSFFTNPIIPEEDLPRVEARWEGAKMPSWPEANGRVKLSAGWLIENAGFKKGLTVGRVAVSSKHALALTNRGGATTKDLIALARQIRSGVFARFGVMLENEPVLVGVTL